MPTRRDRVYFVCNLTTKEFKPLAIPQHKEFTVCSEYLVFDPSKLPHYKVVFLCNYNELSKKLQIEIYSSETATFRSSATNSFTPHYDLSSFVGVYCSDAIHWICNPSFYYVDLNRECINKSPLPPNIVGSVIRFLESRGHLQLLSLDNRYHLNINLLYVYELKRDYSSWSQLYRVDLTFIALGFPLKIKSAIHKEEYSVLSILVDEEEDLTMVLAMYGMFVAYRFRKKLCNVLRYDDCLKRFGWPIAHHNDGLKKRFVRFRWPIAYQFIETLACV